MERWHVEGDEMDGWAAEEVGRAQLGDLRRTKRLVQMVETLADHPAQSVPTACAGEWAAIKATYRFWESEAIDPAAIGAAHREATVRRIGAHSVILAIQD